MITIKDYRERDLVGYGANPPKVEWPGGARLAINVVVNYEEGSETCVLHGDDMCETGHGVDSYAVEPGVRDLDIESIYEYGSRVGFWRLLDIFSEYEIKVSFLCAGKALEMHPQAAREITARGHEPMDHGYRWGKAGSLVGLSLEEERARIRKNVETIQRLTGERPVGQLIGTATLQTRELLAEEGYLYDANDVVGDLPWFVNVKGKKLLIVPYSRTMTDARYWRNNGFVEPNQYFRYAKEWFDRLYKEGATTPKFMNFPLHMRLSGLPGRANAVENFISYAKGFPKVWFARRDEIAKVWIEQFG